MSPDAHEVITMGCFDFTENMEFQAEIVDLAMRGLSLEECGDYYSLDPQEWIDWCAEHPLILLRYKAGKARGIALAGQRLVEEIKCGKIQAITFYLKTQGNFLEKSVMRVEEEVKVTHMPMPPVPTDPVEASKTYAQFMKDS